MPRRLLDLPDPCPDCGKASAGFKTRESYVHHLRRHVMAKEEKDEEAAQTARFNEDVNTMMKYNHGLQEKLKAADKLIETLRRELRQVNGYHDAAEELLLTERRRPFVFRPRRLWDMMRGRGEEGIG